MAKRLSCNLTVSTDGCDSLVRRGPCNSLVGGIIRFYSRCQSRCLPHSHLQVLTAQRQALDRHRQFTQLDICIRCGDIDTIDGAKFDTLETDLLACYRRALDSEREHQSLVPRKRSILERENYYSVSVLIHLSQRGRMIRSPRGKPQQRLVGSDSIRTHYIQLQCSDRLLVSQRGIDQEFTTLRATGKRHLVRAIEVAGNVHTLHPVVGIIAVDVHGRSEFAKLRLLHRNCNLSLFPWRHNERCRRHALGDIFKEHHLLDGQRHIAVIAEAITETVGSAERDIPYLPVGR